MRRDLRLGGLIGINLLLKSNVTPESEGEECGVFSQDILNVIIEELFQVILDFEKQEQIFIASALEVLGSI